jgi:rare lipoprotein A
MLAPVGVSSAAQPVFPAPLPTSLKVRREQLNVLDGHPGSVAGTLLEASHTGKPGRVVTLQALIGRGWHTIALGRTGKRGRFRIAFRPHRLGSRLLRLHFAGDATARSARRRLGRLNVYRLAVASWYGGGGGLACGGELTSSTLGVANKTLPCGTLVTLHYDGHTIRVPVVDRGPYVAGREFDLTEATKRALGFGDTGEVWSTS